MSQNKGTACIAFSSRHHVVIQLVLEITHTQFDYNLQLITCTSFHISFTCGTLLFLTYCRIARLLMLSLWQFCEKMVVTYLIQQKLVVFFFFFVINKNIVFVGYKGFCLDNLIVSQSKVNCPYYLFFETPCCNSVSVKNNTHSLITAYNYLYFFPY